jgi:hypothetical protein
MVWGKKVLPRTAPFGPACYLFQARRTFIGHALNIGYNRKKETSVTKHSKLLCPTCGEAKRVKEIADEHLVLVCRTKTTLPLEPGRLSFESLIGPRSALGKKFFPGKPDDVYPAD